VKFLSAAFSISYFHKILQKGKRIDVMIENVIESDIVNSYPNIAQESLEIDWELVKGKSVFTNNLKLELEPRLIVERELKREYDDLTQRLKILEKLQEISKNEEEKSDDDIKEIAKNSEMIGKLKDELRFYNHKIISDALDVMQYGDPEKFIMKQFSKLHISDIAIGKVLLLSVINTCIFNTEGLQPKLSGESGKGKTHCVKSMFHLMYNAPYKMEGSLSAKSLFYKSDMVDGTVVFSDDIKMTEELESTLKMAMSNYQQNTIHNTLVKQEYVQKKLPKRICWLLTSVESNFSNELVNRLYDQNVDESENMDSKVYDNIFERAESGALAFPENYEIKICRTIIHIIKRKLFTVKIPFASKLKWKAKGDRRNPSRFVALIMGYAVLNYLHRESDGDGSIVADIQDYIKAKALYEEGKENQMTKLSKAELRLVKFMVKSKTYLSINDIVENYVKDNGEKYGYESIRKLIAGIPNQNKPGLIDKIPGITRKFENGEYKYHISEFKEFKGEIVSMDVDNIEKKKR
jgi:hypothetical protein